MSYLSDWHENLYKKALRFSLGFYLILAMIVTLIHLPAPKEPDVKNLSDRVAKLILEPPSVEPPPTVRKVKKTQEKKKVTKKAKEKSKSKKKSPRPSAQQNREIINKSGLLASLIEEEKSGTLSALMENKRLDRALSNVEMISAPSQKKKFSNVKKSVSHKSNLANQKIARLGKLQKKDRVVLEKEDNVSLVSLGGNRLGGNSIYHPKELGNGAGIRLKGGRPSASNLSIDYDAIARVVEKYKSSLIYLYNKELRSNPTLKGTITVEFSIDSKGKVVEAHVITSSMDYAPLETALAKRIKMWKFPHLYDGVIVVTYPFVFFPV